MNIRLLLLTFLIKIYFSFVKYYMVSDINNQFIRQLFRSLFVFNRSVNSEGVVEKTEE